MNAITIGLPVLPINDRSEGTDFFTDTLTNVALKLRIVTVPGETPGFAIQADADLVDENATWDELTGLIRHLKAVIASADLVTPGDNDADIFGNGEAYIAVTLNLTGGPI